MRQALVCAGCSRRRVLVRERAAGHDRCHSRVVEHGLERDGVCRCRYETYPRRILCLPERSPRTRQEVSIGIVNVPDAEDWLLVPDLDDATRLVHGPEFVWTHQRPHR